MGQWVVVLEFSAPLGRRFEVDGIQVLVERLREWHPSGLYNPDRYALQLHVHADGAADALRVAASCHDRVASTVGPAASFSRAEVLTLTEFEESWYDVAGLEHIVPGGAAQALTSVEVYEATRALLSVSNAGEVTDVLVRFVLAVGGRVNVGEARPSLGMLSIDMAVVSGEQLHALAESFSVAGLIIERWLPPLIDDARQTLVLLDGAR